jgi:hypothetical protein
MCTRLEPSELYQSTNIVEEEIDYGENEKQHVPIIELFEAIVASTDMNKNGLN